MEQEKISFSQFKKQKNIYVFLCRFFRHMGGQDIIHKYSYHKNTLICLS